MSEAVEGGGGDSVVAVAAVAVVAVVAVAARVAGGRESGGRESGSPRSHATRASYDATLGGRRFVALSSTSSASSSLLPGSLYAQKRRPL